MRAPGGRRVLKTLTVPCPGCDKLQLLLQGLCVHEPFAFTDPSRWDTKKDIPAMSWLDVTKSVLQISVGMDLSAT